MGLAEAVAGVVVKAAEAARPKLDTRWPRRRSCDCFVDCTRSHRGFRGSKNCDSTRLRRRIRVVR